MFDLKIKNVTTENKKKDFKKLASLVNLAKGQYRNINMFAADCKASGDYIENIIRTRISSYPTIQFLKVIANNSEGRVSLKDLKLACGYSLYENNDLQEIKNIYIRRGWFCYANFGDQVIDSELGGWRTVLIIQNDIGNRFSSNSIVIPLTSRKTKSKLPTHVEVRASECGLYQDSIICCELTRCISKRRLISTKGVVQKVAECPERTMKYVEIALMKAEGTLDININANDAIEVLENLNKNEIFKFRQENNQTNNYKTTPQVVFA